MEISAIEADGNPLFKEDIEMLIVILYFMLTTGGFGGRNSVTRFELS